MTLAAAVPGGGKRLKRHMARGASSQKEDSKTVPPDKLYVLRVELVSAFGSVS